MKAFNRKTNRTTCTYDIVEVLMSAAKTITVGKITNKKRFDQVVNRYLRRVHGSETYTKLGEKS